MFMTERQLKQFLLTGMRITPQLSVLISLTDDLIR